jgi:S-adenosylmethionine decarboxylase
MHHVLGSVEYVSIKTTGELSIIMDRIIERLRLHEVGRTFYQFEPFGATGVILLEESHFAAHTYPEHQRIHVDLFCCSPDFDTNKATSVIMEEFGTDVFQWDYKLRV